MKRMNMAEAAAALRVSPRRLRFWDGFVCS